MAFSFPSTRLNLPLLSPPSFNPTLKTLALPNPKPRVSKMPLPPPKSLSLQHLSGLQSTVLDLVATSPPTWKSAIASNLLIFLVGSPVLVSGLSASGIGAALALGILTWRAFGGSGFLLVATYFVIVSSWDFFDMFDNCCCCKNFER